MGHYGPLWATMGHYGSLWVAVIRVIEVLGRLCGLYVDYMWTICGPYMSYMGLYGGYIEQMCIRELVRGDAAAALAAAGDRRAGLV